MSDPGAPIDPGTLTLKRLRGLARLLRSSGVAIGTQAVMDGMQAVAEMGLARRADVYAALRAAWVVRHDHYPVFDAAFERYFAVDDDMRLLDAAHGAIPASAPPPAAARRVEEALAPQRHGRDDDDESTVSHLTLAESSREILQRKDFAQMSAAELRAAESEIARLRLPLADVVTRRRVPDLRGDTIDIQRTLRASLRSGGEIVRFERRGRATRPPPIVALIDISGSMSEYTRLFLHFLHAVTDARKRVATFLFGTRLTNVTRALRARDPDDALAACSAQVPDWSGGTRIAASLHAFNRLWGRRVLGQGALVLLITDGLEREADQRLAFEMDRLHRSCRRLIWLNPLLRYEGFEARAQGIRLMLPHVDEFRSIHSLNSMAELVAALADPAPRGQWPRRAA